MLVTLAKTACANNVADSYSAIYKKIFASNATSVLDSLTLPRPTGRAYSTVRICIQEKVIKISHGSLVHVGKKQICKFWAVNCSKMRLAAGLCPDPLGEL